MQTVRRYSNRKLYHIEGHRYVNLDDLAALIGAGEQVRVLAHPGGQDITAAVLAQIIVRQRPVELTDLLTALVRRGGAALEGAGRALLSGMGLPSRRDWEDLEGRVARLEQLLQRFDEEEGRVL